MTMNARSARLATEELTMMVHRSSELLASVVLERPPGWWGLAASIAEAAARLESARAELAHLTKLLDAEIYAKKTSP